MPIVKIEYEKEKITRSDIEKVVASIQTFAAQVTGYDLSEISVFASENQITVNAAPIEVYVYATFEDVTEDQMKSMLEKLAELLIPFKKENNIDVPFNVSIVKMNWKFKLEV